MILEKYHIDITVLLELKITSNKTSECHILNWTDTNKICKHNYSILSPVVKFIH